MIIRISGKCSDMSSFYVEGLIDHNGYVPDIDCLGGGDYISLKIENETGKIVGWVPLTENQLLEACGIYEGEDEE